ncbi:bifunctional DNA primase/polymerase [Streptomyces sp. B6B3]|uniref:bifunctional DNA primase/polymerase n=1 Tax=Streptomyces sp. B6B3 TaxID=3153570 RepID=UPI00325DFD37
MHVDPLAPALAAAARGLAVIPLSRTKLPAVRSPHGEQSASRRCRGECGRLGHGVHDATADPDRVRALFAAAPWATGYGIACGRPPHHLIGLDLDVKNGVDGIAAIERLAAEHGFALPPTVTITTPTGGRHLWLSGPADVPVPNSAGRLAPGVDVRGSGGYLVGPGSVTTRGRYTLTAGTERHWIGAAPAGLLSLATPPPVPAPPAPAAAFPSGQRAVALVRFVLEARAGERNSRLYWAACRAHEADDGRQLVAALADAASHVGLPDAEIRATLASSARRRSSGSGR